MSVPRTSHRNSNCVAAARAVVARTQAEAQAKAMGSDGWRAASAGGREAELVCEAGLGAARETHRAGEDVGAGLAEVEREQARTEAQIEGLGSVHDRSRMHGICSEHS